MSEEEKDEILSIILEYDLIDFEFVFEISDEEKRNKIENWILKNKIGKNK